MRQYADIVLPLFSPLYTFAVADDVQLAEGDAVAVQFGRRTLYTGIVWRLHDKRPEVKSVKTVSRKLYDKPLLTPMQMRFWEWISDYYMCTLGEVMRFALPAMTKPRGRDDEAFVRDEYRPRTTSVVLLSRMPEGEEADRLRRRAPRQAALLDMVAAEGEVPRSRCGAAALSALLDKGYVRVEQREVKEFAALSSAPSPTLPQLSPSQTRAVKEIREGWESAPAVLLHGVSGSGKTEIYMHLAAQMLPQGDVLMLVPEIALTTQLTSRIKSLFGERAVEYHSKLSDRRRAETYMELAAGAAGRFIIGTRSALFLPLKNLRLVIVDEEHDGGYKQTEPAPRYQARDAALMLARESGALALLGSATPSLESYVRASSGKYRMVVLDERYGGAMPPVVTISDTLRAVKRGERHSHFNKELIDAISLRLERGEQVLLLQNRRGFAPYAVCGECGHTLRCRHCNVSLTLHRGGTRAFCRYCGRDEAAPDTCPVCGAKAIHPAGFGTEKVESEIMRLFPSARVLRLDSDTAPTESACKHILGSFSRGEADILVGTQIITKGLDFDRVTLAAILNADNLLAAPDFRAGERAFQTIMQFAGRGGRREVQGEVIVQTSEPQHPILLQAARGDYAAMAESQLAERREYAYPPYAHLISISLRHADERMLAAGVQCFAALLRRRFAERVFTSGVSINRGRNGHAAEVLLKIESGASMKRARTLLRETIAAFSGMAEYRNMTIICNVDV
ncbi:MAG: primosomal protein N' [Alistipes sp.]|nr:primosomal protein N' [Alistipes sp.]